MSHIVGHEFRLHDRVEMTARKKAIREAISSSFIGLNGKQNLQPETAPATPDNDLAMLSLPLQILLVDQKPTLITAPTSAVPAIAVAAFRLFAGKILQIHNLQAGMEHIAGLLPFRDLQPIQTQRAIIFGAKGGVR